MEVGGVRVVAIQIQLQGWGWGLSKKRRLFGLVVDRMKFYKKNVDSIGSAVLTSMGYKQTNKNPNREEKVYILV